MSKKRLKKYDEGGIVKGKSHDDGGEHFIVNGSGQHVELEGREAVISAKAFEDEKVHKYVGTNWEILNQINKKYGGNTLYEEVESIGVGDFVICINSVEDDTKREYTGTNDQVISAINESGGCISITKGAKVKDILDGRRSKKMAEGGTTLLAPNGKPSHLTPEQYQLVRTPVFKAWFGDWENSPETASKVIDENGEPLMVFHGTSKDLFYEFMPYAVEYVNGEAIKEFRGNKTDHEFDDYINQYGLRKIEPRFYFSVRHIWGDKNLQCFLNIKNLYVTDEYTPKISKEYDGFRVPNEDGNDYYCVFQSNQIKLADGSNTTFDGNNPDIRFAEGGAIERKRDETYKKWRNLVNMSSSELERFYDSEEGKKAGLTASEAKAQGIGSGRQSARWILRMKDTPKSEWTDEMWSWAGRQVSFISRMSGNEGPLFDDKGRKTRKHLSLLIWGHNPKKKMGGGDVKTEFNEFENGGLRKALLSFWGDFVNGQISNYLNVGEQDYVVTDHNDLMVIFRNGENFSAVEKNKIEHWIEPYFNKDKKPHISKYFVGFSIENNKIIIEIKPNESYAKGGLASKTPSPQKDRIKGSKVNPKESASSSGTASSIVLSDGVINSIKGIIEKHNESHPNKKITLAVAKAVVRRGMGAYSSSHRPTISDGKPNSRVAWGLARLNAFVFKAQHGYSKSGKYSQDNDLFDELGIRHKKFEDGGSLNKGNYAFMNWFVKWYKPIANDINIAFSLPNELQPFLEQDVVILDIFEKINQDVDAKPFLKEITQKADEYGVTIYLEPTPRYNYFQNNIEKRKKISREYLISYYERFGFQLTPDGKFLNRIPKFNTNTTLDGGNPNIMYADGGYVDPFTQQDIKKIYVSIKITYDIGKKDDGTLVGGYELKSINQLPFEELERGVLKGVLGVSGSSYNVSDWLSHMQCLILMDLNKFVQLNNTEQIMYNDAYYLMRNGMDVFYRLFDRKNRTEREYKDVLSNIFKHLTNELQIESKASSNYNVLYFLSVLTDIYSSGKFVTWLSGQDRISSPEQMADLILKYTLDQAKSDYWSQQIPTQEQFDRTKSEIIDSIVKGVLRAARPYRDESEWLIKDAKLKVPEGSQLFFVLGSYDNYKTKYEEAIDKYNLREKYKVYFVNQRDIDRYQSNVFKIKESRYLKENEIFKATVDNRILKAFDEVINDILEEYEKFVVQRAIDNYGEERNPLENKQISFLYNDYIYKLLEYLESEKEYALKTLSKYPFYDAIEKFKRYLKEKINEVGDEKSEYVDSDYRSPYLSDLIQGIFYVAAIELPVEEIVSTIKSKIGSDLYRTYKAQDIKFKKGGDVLKGGKADNMSLTDIAKYHKLNDNELKDFNAEYLKGIKHELEHTENKEMASEIAKDHLFENKNYYTMLESMENKYSQGGKMEMTYTEWEDAVTTELEDILGASRSDAQSVVDANTFYMAQSWAKALTPKETASVIFIKSQKMAKGGSIDPSTAMLLSQTKEIKHHADELSKVIDRKEPTEPWVVGKMERATSDLSDITHYLDGKTEYAEGGTVVNHSIILNDLIGKYFSIEVGSGITSKNWDKENLIKEITNALFHNLFDREFYYNWIDSNEKKEYLQVFKEDTLNPMIQDIDNTLNKYFAFVKRGPKEVLFFKRIDERAWIDNWFNVNKNISKKLKEDYRNYRIKYAGVTPYSKGGKTIKGDGIDDEVVEFNIDSFLVYAHKEISDFLMSNMDGRMLNNDWTFVYKDEPYFIDAFINVRKVSKGRLKEARFVITDKYEKEVGEILFYNGQFKANSKKFEWTEKKFEKGGKTCGGNCGCDDCKHEKYENGGYVFGDSEQSTPFMNGMIYQDVTDYVLGGFTVSDWNSVVIYNNDDPFPMPKIEYIANKRLVKAIDEFKEEIRTNITQAENADMYNIDMVIGSEVENMMNVYLQNNLNTSDTNTIAETIIYHDTYRTWIHKIEDRVGEFNNMNFVQPVFSTKNTTMSPSEIQELTNNYTFELMLEKLSMINDIN